MERNGTLTGNQTAALVLLLDGVGRAETARRVGIGRTTLYRWLTDDAAFQEAYAEAVDATLREARHKVVGATTKAVEALVEIVGDAAAPASARVAAAREILSRAGIDATHTHRVETVSAWRDPMTIQADVDLKDLLLSTHADDRRDLAFTAWDEAPPELDAADGV